MAIACTAALACSLIGCGTQGDEPTGGPDTSPQAAEPVEAPVNEASDPEAPATAPETPAIETEDEPVQTRMIEVAANGTTVAFELNDSSAADALLAQLPLTAEADDFGANEKIFYPPEPLDTTDAPHAEGGPGTLAYYAPWGDVVMFFGGYSPNDGLYELGQAVAGADEITALAGTIEITASE